MSIRMLPGATSVPMTSCIPGVGDLQIEIISARIRPAASSKPPPMIRRLRFRVLKKTVNRRPILAVVGLCVGSRSNHPQPGHSPSLVQGQSAEACPHQRGCPQCASSNVHTPLAWPDSRIPYTASASAFAGTSIAIQRRRATSHEHVRPFSCSQRLLKSAPE